jgi:Domain of unknown function (DUF222)
MMRPYCLQDDVQQFGCHRPIGRTYVLVDSGWRLGVGPDDLLLRDPATERGGGVVDVGQWLIDQRAEMDRAEAVWLQQLAEFDRHGLWAGDGQCSCAAWLVWRTNMARSTAFEKLRVAHQLARRPIVAQAFGQGRLSYSAVRALTRLDRPDPDVDAALVELARSGQPASSTSNGWCAPTGSTPTRTDHPPTTPTGPGT